MTTLTRLKFSHCTVANMKWIRTLDVAQAEQVPSFLLDKVMPLNAERAKRGLVFGDLWRQCIYNACTNWSDPFPIGGRPSER